MSAGVVIVAGGQGRRLGSPKQFEPLGAVPLLLWSVRAFRHHGAFGDVVVVMPAGTDRAPAWLQAEDVRWCEGGTTRRRSASRGIEAVAAGTDPILIHDAARPFVTPELIDRVLEATRRTGAAIPVLPVVDSLKRLEGRHVAGSVDRDSLGRAQTPQGFRADLIRRLHGEADRAGLEAVDDAALCEAESIDVEAVAGDEWNLKITTPADLALAGWLAESGRVRVAGGS